MRGPYRTPVRGYCQKGDHLVEIRQLRYGVCRSCRGYLSLPQRIVALVLGLAIIAGGIWRLVLIRDIPEINPGIILVFAAVALAVVYALKLLLRGIYGHAQADQD